MKDLLAIIQNVGPDANLKIEVDSRDMMAFADALVEKAMAELKTQAVATPPAEDVLVPKKETREILGVCDATLWKWDRLGYLVPVKVGRKIFYWKSHEYEKKARLILDLLTDVLQEKYTRDTTIQLTQVVGQQAISMEIAKIFLSEVFKVEIHPGDTIEVKQGKIDVSKEIIEVLETFGHAMSLDDIYMFFKDKYPDHKYEEAAQLRPSIINSDEIVAIGKSGQYALKKWNTFTGCIKDCAYMILREATEPMPDAELVEKILEYFPNSSFRSIMSTLVSDPLERFTHYTDSSTWLVEKDHLTNKIKVRSRISSEDRFEDLKAFITTYKRWPFASGGDEEASLSRWIYNHSRRDLLPGYDPEEARKIEMLQEEYAHLPHNNSEYEFLNTCSDFKIFLQNNYRLPDENSCDERELELAVWFRKTSTKREPYDDNRRLYFNELLSALEDYGFYFQ